MSDTWHDTTAQLPPGPPPLGLVVAISDNRCIGRRGTLPWHIPEDLVHFRRITTGHAIIMGRSTFESIGRALPRRRNIVVTHRASLEAGGKIELAPGVVEAIALARETDPMPMVIGGSSIFERALPLVTKIHLTRVHGHVDGDRFFPEIRPDEWFEVERRGSDDGRCTFVTLERI